MSRSPTIARGNPLYERRVLCGGDIDDHRNARARRDAALAREVQDNESNPESKVVKSIFQARGSRLCKSQFHVAHSSITRL